jgi:hypothetical protein
MVHVGSGRRCVMDTLLAPASLGRSAVRHDRQCHPFGVVPERGRARRRGCGWAVDGARWGVPRQRRRVGAPGALESRSPARRCSWSQWTWRSQERVSATSATRSLAAPRPGLGSARGLDMATHPGRARDVVVNGRPLTFGNLEEAVPRAGTRLAFSAWLRPSSNRAPPRMTSRGSVSTSTAGWWSGWVLDPEDARRSVDAGVDGIVVSNHGGRQLDPVRSTVRALPT